MNIRSMSGVLGLLVLILVLISCNSIGNRPQNTDRTENADNSTNASPTPAAQPEAGGGQVDTGDPRALVSDLYKQHDGQKGPFFQKDRAKVDKYFSKPLADLIYRDNIKPLDQIGAVGADPLYDGQDFEIKNFAVGTAETKEDRSSVKVTFENFGEKKSVNFSLVLADNTWKIADVKYDHGASLLAILKEAYGGGKTNAPPVKDVQGKFEGTYRIGETTCSVKPDKTAFAVRWAKGKGSEMFFYKDANVFESEPDASGGRNEFRFNDENYNSGTFVRADGKVFTVSRAK